MNSPQSRPQQQPNATEQGGPVYGSPADAFGTSPTGFDPAGYEVERSDFNLTAPVGPVGAGSPPPNASPYPVAYPDQNFPSGNPATDGSAPDSSGQAPKSGSISPGQPSRRHSRAGAAWVALIVAAIVLIFLLIFVVQNSGPVQISYFGFEGTLSLGVAMIFAAIAGALTAGLLGTVRILQLRARARRAAAGK